MPAEKVSFQLGGPWAFYHAFWRAHSIEHVGELNIRICGERLIGRLGAALNKLDQ
jgi:hypothetical protein